MNRPPITIKDIAKAMGTSVSTVSRALRNSPDISKEKRAAINNYAREHNYQPNVMAANLRTNRSNIIGVIIPQISHNFFSRVLSGIEKSAAKKGYQILVAQSNEDYQREVEIVQTFLTSRVCGVITSLAKNTKEYDHYQALLDNNIPIVFYDRICTGIKTERVVIDDYAGAFAAVEYMIKTGCKKIMFFSSPSHLEISKNRKNGYLDAMRKYRIPLDSDMIRYCDTQEQAMAITPQILAQKDRPDGFFAINDETAAGILYACKQAKLKIPEEVSICGFSDSEIAENTDPKLTTVEQNGEEIGESAIGILIHRVEQKDEKTINRIVKTKLVLRETTK